MTEHFYHRTESPFRIHYHEKTDHLRSFPNIFSLILIFFILFLSYPLEALFAGQWNVSVLYFENNTKSKPYDWMKKGLSDMLTSDLGKNQFWHMVERENMEKLIREQQLSELGLVDPGQAIHVGKLLSANKLIYGSFIISGGEMRIDAKITDTATGKILATSSSQGKIGEIFKLEKKIARELLTRLKIPVPESLDVEESHSVQAVQSYYEGVDFLDKGNTDAALKKFKESASIDPLYSRPQRGIEDSYKYLKNFKLLRQQREIHKAYQKAESLRRRLSASGWLTYADLAKKYKISAMNEKQRQQFNKDHDAYMHCQTPAQCTWELMWVYNEIGGKVEEYRGDSLTNKRMRKEMVRLGSEAEKRFSPTDPFASEIRYTKVFAIRWLEDWPRLKVEAEKFLEMYPDYRLVEFVEDMLEVSLKKIQGKDE